MRCTGNNGQLMGAFQMGGSFTKHRKESKGADSPSRILRKRIICLGCEELLPAPRVLLHHQPAADIQHQCRGEKNDDAFERIVMIPGAEDRE